jgi:DNA polymerase-3 subunit delta
LIYLLYGEDALSLEEMLTALKQNAGPAELYDVNVTVLDGAQASHGELVVTASTVPFLSDKRLVIVRGLLSRFEPRTSRNGGRASSSERKLGEWEGLATALKSLPESTELVFVDGGLSTSNPLLKVVRPLAQVHTFPLPSARELPQWIRQRAAKLGVSVEPRAVTTLAETIGSDTRVIDNELQKLSLYRMGQPVRQEDVEEMVSYAKEASIFAAVDAVLEGRAGAAIRMIQQILDAGRPPVYIITMIARQVRLLILAKELKAQRLQQAEIGRRLSLSGYPLTKTLEQEGRFTHQRLVEIHRKLLEADLAIKSGGALDEQMALDMFIVELAVGSSAG